jgi:hypothetical protein
VEHRALQTVGNPIRGNLKSCVPSKLCLKIDLQLLYNGIEYAVTPKRAGTKDPDTVNPMAA